MILLQRLSKEFPGAQRGFKALQQVTLDIAAQQFVAVVGKSGSGKSTLLNLIAGIERPSSGAIEVLGSDIRAMNESSLAEWRGRHVGIVFQSFQLLPTLTVLENVALPMDFCKTASKSEAAKRAAQLLDQMGIGEHAGKFPFELSGGQQQRVAIARALANDPPLILADEPTGNLDSQTTKDVLALLQGLTKIGKTILMVTHEQDLSQIADRIITLADGKVISDTSAASNHQVASWR